MRTIHPNGATKQDSGTPLHFHFVQGTDPVRIKTAYDYLDMTYGGNYLRYNLDAVPQYSAASPEYTDSEEVKSGFRFDDDSNEFQIQDDLSITYDYEEALSPVYLNQLGLAPEYGLGYRLYVKDAQTGQVEIRTLVPGDVYPNYTPKSISYDGQTVTETVIDGTGMTDYTFADANLPGNKKYIARVEVFKKEYEYNQRGSFSFFVANSPFGGEHKNWFTFKMRAYQSSPFGRHGHSGQL